jgi:hypothetical protein
VISGGKGGGSVLLITAPAVWISCAGLLGLRGSAGSLSCMSRANCMPTVTISVSNWGSGSGTWTSLSGDDPSERFSTPVVDANGNASSESLLSRVSALALCHEL